MNIDWCAGSVDHQRCVACNRFIVDAWFCDECGMSFGLPRMYDDRRSSTATTISRRLQQRENRAAAHEQWMDMVSAHDGDVTSVDQQIHHDNVPSCHGASARVRRLIRNESHGIGHDFYAKVAAFAIPGEDGGFNYGHRRRSAA